MARGARPIGLRAIHFVLFFRADQRFIGQARFSPSDSVGRFKDQARNNRERGVRGEVLDLADFSRRMIFRLAFAAFPPPFIAARI